MSTFADDLFQFVRDMNRGYAAALRDSAARVAPPDREVAGPAFEELPLSRQLDAMDIACRRALYRDALLEALPESDLYQPWLGKLIDSSVADADIGRIARRMVVAYLQSVAGAHDENLAEFA